MGIPDSNFPDNVVFMKRIENICIEKGSRHMFNTSDPVVIMCFLPQNNIAKLSEAVEKLLKNDHPLFGSDGIYEILSINSDVTNDPKQEIESAKIMSKRKNKKGLLVLSGRQCSLGVTIHMCDIVLLLNNNYSYDLLYQMMFRCMTEGSGKKCGFVVDLNIHRTIETTLMEYANIVKPALHPKHAIDYLIRNRILGINSDHWEIYSKNPIKALDALIENVYTVYSSNTEKALEQLLGRLTNKEVELSDKDQNLLNMFDIGKNSGKLSTVLQTNEEELQKGIEKVKKENSECSEEENEVEEVVEEQKVEDVNPYVILKHIVPPVCLLTIHKPDSTTLGEMYNDITSKESLNNILESQVERWWGRKADINNFMDIFIKYMSGDKELNQIIRTIKELFVKAKDDREELSKLIDKYLIPTELEKKGSAEVSTPYELRQEMLDKIPEEFWSSPRKVFEPCSGKGGFLIDIVDRFDRGLEELIEDPDERYRVIVEECLYFGDINEMNIFIAKLLLNPDREYKLNYNKGDTLELDILEKWNLDGFDLVVGNPPYQPESNGKKGGKSIWDEFVKYSLNILKKNKYLLFVHPALWRKPENKLKDIMFSKQIHYLSIHGDTEGLKKFKSTTRYDHYLLENTEVYKKSIVTFEDKKTYNILINDKLPFIPNYGWSIFKKVLDKLNDNGIIATNDSQCHTSRDYVSKIKKKGYDYVLLNSISNSKGKTYAYSSKPHKVQTNLKVLFSNGRHIVPFYDNGELGITQGGIYILVKDKNEGIRIVEYLNTNLVKFLMKATKWSNFETSKQLFWYIPKPDEIDIIDDENVNKYFGLTKEEINTINS